MSREPIGWFTVNGQHIPILKGETKEQAFKNRMAERSKQVKQESDRKDSQINHSKAEAEQKNAEDKPLPRRLPLSDVKAEDANKTSDVLLLGTKRRFRFKEGTKIQGIYVFAGAGTSKVFRDAQRYADRYRKLGLGKTEDWQHCAGWAIITNDNVTMRREIHWVQGKDGKIREAFIKVRK